MTLRPLLRPHTSRRPSRGAATSHGTLADPSSRIFTSAVPRQHSAPHQVRTTAPKCRITGRVRQADRLTEDSDPRRHRHDSVQAKLGGLAQDANPAFLVECGAQAVGRGVRGFAEPQLGCWASPDARGSLVSQRCGVSSCLLPTRYHLLCFPATGAVHLCTSSPYSQHDCRFSSPDAADRGRPSA